MTLTAIQFQSLLLSWFDANGRKDLPWQKPKTGYRVWVSEIMLQQTQVSTVIAYYEKFMHRFPSIESLADAKLDDVLNLWAGLGYYTRARNLHKTAKIITDKYQGIFPSRFEDLISLPGIGRSTAGAILAIAFNQPTPILDGNVKRVLSRVHAIREPINDKTVENKLWCLAETFTPSTRVADYTQAIMDIGAMICTRHKPRCEICTLKSHCLSFQHNLVTLIPAKKTSRPLPTRQATFLIIKKNRKVLLIKRPNVGIWGGLFSFPELAGESCITTIKQFCHQQLNVNSIAITSLPTFKHTFTHFNLSIFPMLIEIKSKSLQIKEDNYYWYELNKAEQVGLPKPVKTLIENLKERCS